MEMFTQIFSSAVTAGTPLLLATLGGILNEKSGVIQLGAEGIMLMGAVSAAGIWLASGSMPLAILGTLVITGGLGLIHAFLTVSLRSNQIVSGLAMTLFGTGLSAYLGKSITGIPMPDRLPKLDLGLFGLQDFFSITSILIAILLAILLSRTRIGLHVRAVGDNPATADVMGIPVQGYRYVCCIIGAMLMGLGGAALLMVFSPTWTEGMSTGRGWIAVALIIFARWNPLGAIASTWFFGLLATIGFRMQADGIPIPAYFLKMLPYLLTITVLILIGWRTKNKLSTAPQALGQPWIREQRF